MAASIKTIENEIEEIESERAYIGIVTSTFRDTSIRAVGSTSFRDLSTGDELGPGDSLKTGPRGRITIELYDLIEEKNAGPTVINIGSNSEITITHIRFHREIDAQRLASMPADEFYLERFFDLVRGVTKVFTKGLGGEAAFSVRTGTSLCGSRGTEIEIEYDPEIDLVEYRLTEGAVEISAPSGKLSLREGSQLTVDKGQIGTPQPLEPSAVQIPAA